MKRDAALCEEILTAYALGISNQGHKLLKELPVEAKLSLFTLPLVGKE
jgi:hypothetical protein